MKEEIERLKLIYRSLKDEFTDIKQALIRMNDEIEALDDVIGDLEYIVAEEKEKIGES